MKYLLDTNICIHLIHRHPESLLARIETLTYGEACLSSIVLAEFRYGAEKNPESRLLATTALNAMLSFFPVLPFDRLIAAHARSRDLILVTNNTKDFEDYPGLTIENWV